MLLLMVIMKEPEFNFKHGTSSGTALIVYDCKLAVLYSYVAFIPVSCRYSQPSKCSSKIVVMSSAVSSAKEAMGKSRKSSNRIFFINVF